VFGGSGGNPALIGPAIFASLIWDVICDADKPESVYFSCPTLNMVTVYSKGDRNNQALFSVSPPEVGTWCTYANKSLPRFTTHALLGDSLTEQPSESEIANTIALFASEVRVPEADVNALGNFKAFVEKWIDRGLGAKIDGDVMTVDMTRQDRFNVLNKTVTLDTRTDAECLRYEYSMEEHDNPIVKNKILLLHDFSMICRVPSQESKLIIATLSERYVKAQQIDAALFSKYKTVVAEPFFDSLEITDSVES